MKKTCKQCKEEKFIDEFAIQRSCIDGKTMKCKQCIKKYQYERNKDPDIKKKKSLYNKLYRRL